MFADPFLTLGIKLNVSQIRKLKCLLKRRQIRVLLKNSLQLHPLNRLNVPDDIAKMAVVLGSANAG